MSLPDRGFVAAAAVLTAKAPGGTVVQVPPNPVLPPDQTWVGKAAEAASRALTTLSTWAQRLGITQLLDRLKQYTQIVAEWRKVGVMMSEFLAKSVVDERAINARVAAYRRGSDNADRAADSAAAVRTGLAKVWQGAAHAAATARLGEWGTLCRRGGTHLDAMAFALAAAGMGMWQARKVGIDAIQRGRARVQALPTPKYPTPQGWAVLNPKAQIEALRSYVQAWIAYVGRVSQELYRAGGEVVQKSQVHITEGTRQLGILTRLGKAAQRAGLILTTGKDPGPQTNPIGAWPKSLTGTGNKDFDAVAISLMAHFAGNVGKITLPPNWERVGTAGLTQMGLDPDKFTHPNGFRAGLYRNSATGAIVVVFGGTSFFSHEDPVEDARGAVSFSDQSASAERIIRELRASGNLTNVAFAGHSLGGRLAAMAAASTGHPAVTVNAAGVSDATYGYYAGLQDRDPAEIRRELDAGNVRAYRTHDDVLTLAQEKWSTAPLMHDAPGHHIELKGNAAVFPLPWGGSVTNYFGGHVMKNVIWAYDNAYGTSIGSAHPTWHSTRQPSLNP